MIHHKRSLRMITVVFIAALYITAALSAGIAATTSELIEKKTAKGLVFVDFNRNLKFDSGERGLQGVSVSNGTEVTQTNKDGKYEIAIDEETILFITKPPGYAVPLDENNLPQFYYLHYPKGSPKQKYKGVAPTGKLPRSIDFPLFKTNDQTEFDVLVFADTQPKTKEEVDYVRDDVVAELVGIDVSFGVTLGDIMFDELELWPRQNQIIARLGIPFYNVPGNHDMNFDAVDDQYALETFKSIFGPPYFSFDYGEVHFVAFDDVDYQGWNPETERAQYQGKIGKKQLEWLANDLKFVDESKLVVFLMHIPFYNSQSDNPAVNVVDRDKLFDIFKDRKHLLALAGHLHQVRHDYLDEKADWYGDKPLDLISCAAVSGAWWSGPKDEHGIPAAIQTDGTPNGYYLFSFKGNQWTEKFYAAGKDRDEQIRFISPVGNIAKSELDSIQILVNVFNGSPKSSVYYRINDSATKLMKHTPQEDPFFVELIKNNKASFKSFVQPRISDHIWSAPIPKDLSPGLHVISVEVIDRHDRMYTASSIFEVY